MHKTIGVVVAMIMAVPSCLAQFIPPLGVPTAGTGPSIFYSGPFPGRRVVCQVFESPVNGLVQTLSARMRSLSSPLQVRISLHCVGESIGVSPNISPNAPSVNQQQRLATVVVKVLPGPWQFYANNPTLPFADRPQIQAGRRYAIVIEPEGTWPTGAIVQVNHFNNNTAIVGDAFNFTINSTNAWVPTPTFSPSLPALPLDLAARVVYGAIPAPAIPDPCATRVWRLVAGQNSGPMPTNLGGTPEFTMAIDECRNEIVYFGSTSPSGSTNCATGYCGQTWRYNLLTNQWTPWVIPNSLTRVPDARRGAQLAWDRSNCRLILFGGRPEQPNQVVIRNCLTGVNPPNVFDPDAMWFWQGPTAGWTRNNGGILNVSALTQGLVTCNSVAACAPAWYSLTTNRDSGEILLIGNRGCGSNGYGPATQVWNGLSWSAPHALTAVHCNPRGGAIRYPHSSEFTSAAFIPQGTPFSPNRGVFAVFGGTTGGADVNDPYCATTGYGDSLSIGDAADWQSAGPPNFPTVNWNDTGIKGATTTASNPSVGPVNFARAGADMAADSLGRLVMVGDRNLDTTSNANAYRETWELNTPFGADATWRMTNDYAVSGIGPGSTTCTGRARIEIVYDAHRDRFLAYDGCRMWEYVSIANTAASLIEFVPDGETDCQDISAFLYTLAGASLPICRSIDVDGNQIFPEDSDASCARWLWFLESPTHTCTALSGGNACYASMSSSNAAILAWLADWDENGAVNCADKAYFQSLVAAGQTACDGIPLGSGNPGTPLANININDVDSVIDSVIIAAGGTPCP